jgi:crossover junction endodeoxyribonuclease RuvC
MIVAGIDPSTHTGVVIINEKLEILYSKLYNVEQKGLLGAQVLGNKCKRIVRDYEVTSVFIEGISWGSQNKNVLEMLAVINILLRHYLFNVCSVYVVPPLTMKKFITGNGKATKKDIAMGLKTTWNLFLSNEHLRDALGLAITGVYYLNNLNSPWGYKLQNKIRRVQ